MSDAMVKRAGGPPPAPAALLPGEEIQERGQDIGLGSKLRELGLLWARGRREQRKGKRR